MIGLPFVYTAAGAMFAFYAALSLIRRNIGNAGFWGLVAASFLLGDRLSDLANGCLVLGLVAIAASGLMRRSREPDADRSAEAVRHGNRLFLPVLVVPVTALAGTLALQHWPGVADPKQGTLVALVCGALLALAICYLWLRPRPLAPFGEGLRLMDSVGWAAVLPQMLASLGAVFALSHVGTVVGGLIDAIVPQGSLIGAVAAYGLGMALFTMIMGNAFAAFPVMMTAVGLPLLIHGHHGNPPAVAAIGMLCGFCGTLLTPMAANFNIVPAVLLELKDRYGVIRAQVATALPLLLVNLLLIWLFAFPGAS